MKPSRINGFGDRAANAGGEVGGLRAASPGPCRRSRAGWSSAPRADRSARRPRPVRSRSSTARPRGRRHAGAVEEGLLQHPVLADPQDRGRRAHRLQRGKKIKAFGADILELEADHIDRGGECAKRRRLVVVADGRRGGRPGWPGCPVRGSGCGSDSRAGRRPAPTSGQAGRRPRGRWWRSAAAGERHSRRVVAARPARSRLLLRAGIQPRGQRRIAGGQDRGGQQRRVHRAGAADGQGADRDAGRHLHDRKQAVHALESCGFPPARRAPAAGSRRRTCRADAPHRRRRR